MASRAIVLLRCLRMGDAGPSITRDINEDPADSETDVDLEALKSEITEMADADRDRAARNAPLQSAHRGSPVDSRVAITPASECSSYTRSFTRCRRRASAGHRLPG